MTKITFKEDQLGRLKAELADDVVKAMLARSGLKSRKRRHVKKRIKRLLNNLLLDMIDEYDNE